MVKRAVAAANDYVRAIVKLGEKFRVIFNFSHVAKHEIFRAEPLGKIFRFPSSVAVPCNRIIQNVFFQWLYFLLS